MKTKIFLTITVIFLLIGCKPTYQQTIDKYLQENLKDPKSYECIELGTPKLYTPMIMGVEKIMLDVKQGNLPVDSMSSQLSRIKAYYEANGTNPYDTLGWSVEHEYRAKNSFGGYVVRKVRYVLSEDQTEIIEIKEL